MKIVFVQKVKAFAGSEKYFISIIPELTNCGCNITLVLVINKIDKEACKGYLDQLSNSKINFLIIDAKSDRSILSTTKALGKKINELNPDLVHSHLIHADFWCAILKKRGKLKQKLVSTKHGYEESYLAAKGFNGNEVPHNTYYRMCKFSEKYIDRSFAVSEGLRNLFIDSKISESKKISTIHHGFELGDKPSITSNKRISDYQIVIIGRVIPFKGHHLGLEAFVKVLEEIPEAKCIIVGGCEAVYKAQLDEIIRKNKIENAVNFTGFQSDIYNYLLSSDILIVPSISEGFGLVFLEGFNAEIPIIGFNVAATNEIIENNKNGILVPPYDTSKLAKEMILLLKDKLKRKQLSTEARKKLLSYFNITRMTDETLLFYNNVIQTND